MSNFKWCCPGCGMTGADESIRRCPRCNAILNPPQPCRGNCAACKMGPHRADTNQNKPQKVSFLDKLRKQTI